MKILKILNPQGWLGQLILIASILSTAFVGGLYYGTKQCPPTTQINNDIKNKAKRGSKAVLDLGDCDHKSWYKSLDKKQKRALSKGL